MRGSGMGGDAELNDDPADPQQAPPGRGVVGPALRQLGRSTVGQRDQWLIELLAGSYPSITQQNC